MCTIELRILLFAACLSISLLTFSQSKPISVQDPLNDSIEVYVKKGRYNKAESFARQLLLKAKNESGTESQGYMKALVAHADLLRQAGNHMDALAGFLEALALRQKTLGENHPEVGSSFRSIGQLYVDLGKYPEAESYLLKAIAIQEVIEPDRNVELASSYSGLGLLYTRMGDFDRSELYNYKALEIRKLAFNDQHAQVGASYNNLGVLYQTQGNFVKAEPFFRSALQIRMHNLGEKHPDVGVSKVNLGIIYQNMGDYQKAVAYYQEAVTIITETLGKTHPYIAIAYQNLAVVYKYLLDFPKAEKYAVAAIELRKISQKETNPADALFYINLAEIHREMYLFSKAEKDCLEGLRIQKQYLGAQSFELGLNYISLGTIYTLTGNFAKAETNLLKAIQILKISLGGSHPYLVPAYYGLGDLYRNMAWDDKAEMAYKQANDIVLKEIQTYFPSLSDGEKLAFFSTLEPDIAVLPAFGAQRIKKNPSITTDIYNNRLATKSLLLNASLRWKQRIKQSADKKLLNLYNKWEDIQSQVARLYMATDSSERLGLDSLLLQSTILEKELSIRSEAYGKMADKKSTTWKEVQAVLKPGEAAIEMIRFQKYGILRTVTDSSDPKRPTYTLKGLTDSILYGALIVKPGLKYPKLVILENGNDLETKDAIYYKNCIHGQVIDQLSYKHFWEKIGENIGRDTKCIYFSPEGIYHSINLGTLYNPQTKKYLLDELDIRIVTVTKDLLAPKKEEEMNKLACLFGYPNYNTSTTDRQKLATLQRTRPELSYTLKLTRGNAFNELPGTRSEIEGISSILRQNGWRVETLTGDNALEETLKESYNPSILHIATHGFFQADTTYGENPLIRSGLLLSGANKTLAGEKDDQVEDGILTAYEAMNLNLDNTDLVVLSACETGLGEIKNGEGVYGLQRAFKVAGAKSIIMSLWKVSDQATQELMVSFYRHWLNSPQTPEGGLKLPNPKLSGNTPPKSPPSRGGLGGAKRAAFLKAQKELKAKYPNPYFWGAFVMVGE